MAGEEYSLSQTLQHLLGNQIVACRLQLVDEQAQVLVEEVMELALEVGIPA
jgi:hypothetical protein